MPGVNGVISAVNSAWVDTKDEFVAQTDDATPVTAYRFPVGEDKIVGVEIYAGIYNLAGNQMGVAKADAAFGRANGNVFRPGNPTGSVVGSNLTGLSLSAVQLVVNNQGENRAIDIILTGKSTEALRWHVRLVFHVSA